MIVSFIRASIGICIAIAILWVGIHIMSLIGIAIILILPVWYKVTPHSVPCFYCKIRRKQTCSICQGTPSLYLVGVNIALASALYSISLMSVYGETYLLTQILTSHAPYQSKA
jgi:hypothetical protein